jgi:hypothetical protein
VLRLRPPLLPFASPPAACQPQTPVGVIDAASAASSRQSLLLRLRLRSPTADDCCATSASPCRVMTLLCSLRSWCDSRIHTTTCHTPRWPIVVVRSTSDTPRARRVSGGECRRHTALTMLGSDAQHCSWGVIDPCEDASPLACALPPLPPPPRRLSWRRRYMSTYLTLHLNT